MRTEAITNSKARSWRTFAAGAIFRTVSHDFVAATAKCSERGRWAADAYVVEYSEQKNETTKLYFDAETGLAIAA